ncbi:hypothetical protein NGL45_01435 [Lactococcus lactis]|uniref:hypothetical protein n=1 Tax=Lactococcus lactis TaxID=1358 RepID=UPI0038D1CE44
MKSIYRKKTRLKIVGTLLVIFSLGICLLVDSFVKADTDLLRKPTEVEVTFTSNGTPAGLQTMFTQNIQVAYEKIKSGNFTSEDLSSNGWTQVAQNFPHTQNTISLSNGVDIGLNVKHTNQEARDIISFLYQESYKALVNQLNGSETETSIIKFNVPGNKGRNYTDNKGRGEAKAYAGLNVIMDLQQNFVTFIDVKSNPSEFKVDVQNKDDRVSLTLVNVNPSAKTAPSEYTVEYNQDLEYVLKVDKSLLKNGTRVQFNPMASIVIDKVSIPYTTAEVLSTANPDGTYSPLQTYTIDLPASTTDAEVTITAHLAPEVYNPVSQNQIKAYAALNASFNIVAAANGPIVNYTIPCVSDNITTSGINFAITDPEKNVLVDGGEYVLGKIENGEKYIYDKKAQWTRISELSNLEYSEYQPVTGGYQYIIGLNQNPVIPLNTTRYSFDASKDSQVNKGLIQLRGLSPEAEYFLYQKVAPKGYSKINHQQEFTIFNKTILSTNNSWITNNSIGFAEHQSFKINSQIPDYAAGKNEYNTLSVTEKKIIPFNSLKKIIIPIALAIILTFIILLVLLKFM